MKKDNFLIAIINFITPIILLYAIFFLVDFLNNGFFAFIYSLMIFACAVMIYILKDYNIKNLLNKYNEIISYVMVLSFIFYLVIALLFITDFFAI